MAIKKKTVADAVSSAKKATKAESVSTNFDDVFNVPQDKGSNSDKVTKEYELFLGKDRLVRYLPITWNEKYKGKSLRFVIYHDEECPPARFGSLADLEYLEKKYPPYAKWFISDNLCQNGRHRYVIYKMHILGVVDTIEG
jgi:hypothetical protein